jgi:hypothetical protein
VISIANRSIASCAFGPVTLRPSRISRGNGVRTDRLLNGPAVSRRIARAFSSLMTCSSGLQVRRRRRATGSTKAMCLRQLRAETERAKVSGQ